jgi:hypothetical protein
MKHQKKRHPKKGKEIKRIKKKGSKQVKHPTQGIVYSL